MGRRVVKLFCRHQVEQSLDAMISSKSLSQAPQIEHRDLLYPLSASETPVSAGQPMSDA